MSAVATKTATPATAPAFWELDLPLSTSSAVDLKNTLKATVTSSSSFLVSWLSSQIQRAVRAALRKHPTTTTITQGSTPPSDLDEAQQQKITATIFKNLVTAVQSLKVMDAPEDISSTDVGHGDHDNEEEEEEEDVYPPNRKRRKVMRQKRRILCDPYHVWFQLSNSSSESHDEGADRTPNGNTYWDEDQDDLPTTLGGKLAIISAGGILNAISSCFLCSTPVVPIHPKVLLQQAARSGAVLQWKQQQELTGLPGVTISMMHAIAITLHVAIAEQVQSDIVRTTPLRIQSLLAADLTAAEFQSVRRRLYDTVILGKGVQTQTSSSTEDANDPAVVLGGTNASQQHEIDKYKKCPGCGNNDQSEFVLDRKNGDVICSICGIVVSESIMHEGSQFRKFEGEVDRNHHGDAANPLYSNAHNMGTSLSGVMPTTGAGLGGKGTGRSSRNLETILKNAHAYTELNVSQFGRSDARRTRIGYKDRQKKSAFAQMTHAGDALNLHEAVVQRAKELFAGFRDDRELVQQFKGVLAACLCEAFEQLSAEGKHLLRQQQQMLDQQEQKMKGDEKPSVVFSGRAARRSELHHATMAGKGVLLLNTPPVVSVGNHTGAATATSPTTATESTTINEDGKISGEKPAAMWDLEDCRSWLLQASRNIAQAWVDEGKTNISSGTPDHLKIPTGSVDELEGRLVEHAITLCEHLENELKSRASVSAAPKGRVVTPRVQDMAKIGIKWQHAHERGSGGKGGVGGSGAIPNGGGPGGRTAGQILLLKTAKKLGALLNDPVAGEAIHRELRAVISRQEAWKQREMREEATRQRFHQMQRKPWLAAKAQQ